MMNPYLPFVVIFVLFFGKNSWGQNDCWHGIKRSIRYQPEGHAFVIHNGERRFNRALYGSNTGFRVETGDLPEFALYMPRLGGTIRLGLMTDTSSQWLIGADSITARYQAGKMTYQVKDKLLGNGSLLIEVLAMYEVEGILFRTRFEGLEKPVALFWIYGGASDDRFNRDGDIGADPESVFYLTAENCEGNEFQLKGHTFQLNYLSKDKNFKPDKKRMLGITPPASQIKLVNAGIQESPTLCFAATATNNPAIAGKTAPSSDWQYFLIGHPIEEFTLTYPELPAVFEKTDQIRQKLAGRVKINTPDPYLNTLGGTLSMAADAIWESPGYLHGAIAWRQALNGWRGAYVADPLGWHDRAKTHFQAYAKSQLTEPASGPSTPDTSRNFARQKEAIGTAIFTSGYISRYPGGERLQAHHYDMNQVFIDQVLRHFNWTGDLDFVREMWPTLERHLAWEKRCFDVDNDALYDAYCSFWASDAVQYSGGGVTHASAYHYYANSRMAELAQLLGKNPTPYLQEASKIRAALNQQLWMPVKGSYAEFKDLLGLQQLHTSPGLWSIYHAIDSEVPDAFQTYQMLQYIDQEIPHIPIQAKGLPQDDFYTLSTTNWLPYTWSVNNVALAEVLHTALAYWQGGQKESAFLLWKSALMESMYLGASPGSIQQLSFYDAIRGELYRDFADPIGMTARSLVEGLFGISPDALNKVLTIRPGFPEDWANASMEIPDLAFEFEHKGLIDYYFIKPAFGKKMELRFVVSARTDSLQSVRINGDEVDWTTIKSSVGSPTIEIIYDVAEQYELEITWAGDQLEDLQNPLSALVKETLEIPMDKAEVIGIHDPQKVCEGYYLEGKKLKLEMGSSLGQKTAFLHVKQGAFSWWEPISVEVKNPLEIHPVVEQSGQKLNFRVINHTNDFVKARLFLETSTELPLQEIALAAGEPSEEINLTSEYLVSGTNLVRLEWGDNKSIEKAIINWDIRNNEASAKYETIDLTPYFNEQVGNIFKQEYHSPRPTSPTVQLPLQGIGNWCYPLVNVEIDDAGLRQLAAPENLFQLPQNIPFSTPSKAGQNNILFTSRWDNFPNEVSIPLSGKAAHLYLLMAGSTNPMQSRLENGHVEITYTDGSTATLSLRNPESWWPIEQDYYLDGFAFYSDLPIPPRIHLKTGLVTRNYSNYTNIKGFSSTGIDGGAATVLDLPLDPEKELKSLKLETLANDVVIGLMGITLLDLGN